MKYKKLSWKTVQSEQVADCEVFSVCRNRSRWLIDGDGQTLQNFYVIHPTNWVNVIPIDEHGQVIMVEQFRHGIQGITLEIPGGMVDPEDESSQHAAQRELLEETGYASDEWTYLGRNHPNPALQSNICDTYLARSARRIAEPRFDGNENIALRLVAVDDIPELILSGTITHALVVVAFHLLHLQSSGK